MPPKVKVDQRPDGTPKAYWAPVYVDTLTSPKVEDDKLGAAKVYPKEGRIYRKVKGTPLEKE